MLLTLWRLAAVLFTSLSMGAALVHLLELPAKIRMEGGQWLTLLQTLYPPGFGTAGAFFEVAAVVTTAVLVLLVRRRGPAFRWSLLAALCVAAAHAIFWIWIVPVNAALLPIAEQDLPPGWSGLRAQWEYMYAARAVLQIAALLFLTCSLLAEIPPHGPPRRQA